MNQIKETGRELSSPPMTIHEVKSLRTVGSKHELVLKQQHVGKMSMARSFKAMALDAKATTEARVWAESGVADGVEND